MTKAKYKAVIFDFDDTLVETHVIKWEHHKTVAKKFYNIDLTEEVILKHWGKPLHILIPELYQHSDTYENMISAYVSIKNDFLKSIFNGSIETITTLLDHGIKVGLLSATNKDFLLDDLARFNFPINRLTVIQAAEDTSVHKPHPDVFLPLLNKLKEEGITNKDIVYVGDSIDDLQAAHGAGIDFIAVTTGLYSREDFKAEGVKMIVKYIKETTKFLIA